MYRMVEKPGMDRLQPEPCEFRVELVMEDDIEFVSEEDRWKMSEEEAKAVTGKLDENKIGGTPVFMQGDEFPFNDGWQLLLQLDSCSVPFSRTPAELHCYSRTIPFSFTCHNCPLSTFNAVSQPPLQQFVSRHFK